MRRSKQAASARTRVGAVRFPVRAHPRQHKYEARRSLQALHTRSRHWRVLLAITLPAATQPQPFPIRRTIRSTTSWRGGERRAVRIRRLGKSSAARRGWRTARARRAGERWHRRAQRVGTAFRSVGAVAEGDREGRPASAAAGDERRQWRAASHWRAAAAPKRCSCAPALCRRSEPAWLALAAAPRVRLCVCSRGCVAPSASCGGAHGGGGHRGGLRAGGRSRRRRGD